MTDDIPCVQTNSSTLSLEILGQKNCGIRTRCRFVPDYRVHRLTVHRFTERISRKSQYYENLDFV